MFSMKKMKWRIKRLIEWYGCVLCNQDIEVKLKVKTEADTIILSVGRKAKVEADLMKASQKSCKRKFI
jgi:hypothetical protein